MSPVYSERAMKIQKGQRLRFRRETSQVLLRTLLAHGLTQMEIAESIGVTQAAVSRWVAGLNVPGIPILTALRLLAERRSIPVHEPEVWREI